VHVLFTFILFTFNFPLRYFYASGGQGHSPCAPRIREADAGRFAQGRKSSKNEN
jgi:hypothetical protein